VALTGTGVEPKSIFVAERHSGSSFSEGHYPESKKNECKQMLEYFLDLLSI
jgi:hypothetical protein